MRITKFSSSNIGKAGKVSFEPKQTNIFVGPNGVGKSLLMKSIQSILTQPRGKDFVGLLADGEDFGEIEAKFEKGVTIRRDITEAGSPLTVEGKALGTLREASANKYVKGTFDAESVNVEGFLTEDMEKLTQHVLEAIPFTLDVDALKAKIGDVELTEGHPLLVIDRLHKQFYDERASVNKEAKSKRAAADQLAETIQSEVDMALLNSNIRRIERDIVASEEQRKEKIESVEIRESKIVTEITDLSAKRVEQEQKERDAFVSMEQTRVRAEIKRLEDALNSSIASADQLLLRVKNETKDAIQAARDNMRSQIDDVRSEQDAIHEDTVTSFKNELANLRNTRDNEVAAEAQRKIVQDMARDAAYLDERSRDLSAELDAIDEFKGNMLKELPIPGVELRDGAIWLDGKPMDQVPESRRVIFGIDLAIVRVGKDGILLIDGAERIDNNQFKIVVKHLQQCECQSFLARASVGTSEKPITELQIVTLEGN